MKAQTLDRSRAARKAFEAYEAAVKAAQEIIEQGPPKGLDSCVMTRDSDWHQRYTCSECGDAGGASRDWKFCPHCGSEIIRFDEPEAEVRTVTVRVTQET
jgi:rubrerythrin